MSLIEQLGEEEMRFTCGTIALSRKVFTINLLTMFLRSPQEVQKIYLRIKVPSL